MSEEKKQQAKPAQKDQLLVNNMGLSPSATVFNFPSTLVEKTILRWLESKEIDTSSITIRVILKDEWRGAQALTKASNTTQLPFLVVLFKQLVEDNDFDIKGGLGSDVMRQLRAGLNNFRDFSQLELRDDTPLNRLLTSFNGGRKVIWNLVKKSRRAYTVLDSDSVMALCFDLPKNEFGNYQFDFLDKPRSRVNPENHRKEFWLNVAFSRARHKRRPTQDPLNDIR